ncbi:MAG: carbohydrate-binding protein, partial [Marinoscillum sp.]
GLVLEETSDTGGGFNIGYTNAGDYLEYRINVKDSGIYQITSRVACQGNAGEFSLQQISEDGAVINEASSSVPVTGGWQEWETVSDGEIKLDKGRWVLRLTITDPEFNLNWIRLTKKKLITGVNSNSELVLYPNPTQRFLKISASTYDQFKVVRLDGSNVLSGQISDKKSINLKALSSGTYVLILMDTKVRKYSYHRILKGE